MNLDFFNADTILIDIMILYGDGQALARHVQSTQNRKLVMFLQYLQEKTVATAFVIYCEAKHSDILLGPVMFVLTSS